MTSIAVHLNAEIIKWLLKKAELMQADSSVMEVLRQWYSGEKAPTFSKVELLSKKLNIPFGYFFLNTPPIEKCAIIDYRTIDSVALQNPSQNLLDTIYKMQNIQEWMADYYLENGYEELSFVGAGNIHSSVQENVQKLRDLLGLPSDWYRSCRNAAASFRLVREKCQNLGIIVMMNGIVGNNTHRKLDASEFRAFTLIDKYAPLIFINSADTRSGNLFSLLHELVHVWLGKNSFYNTEAHSNSQVSALESRCNAIAAEILVPQDAFIKQWSNNGALLEKLGELAAYFRCSRIVIARRALDKRLITSEEYSLAVNIILSEYKKYAREAKASGGDFYKNLKAKIDPKVVLAMHSSAMAGNLQYTSMYRMTDTNRKTFDKLLVAVEG